MDVFSGLENSLEVWELLLLTLMLASDSALLVFFTDLEKSKIYAAFSEIYVLQMIMFSFNDKGIVCLTFIVVAAINTFRSSLFLVS